MKIFSTRLHPDLPIFRLDSDDQSYIYTPGYSCVVTREEADELHSIFASNKSCFSASLEKLTTSLENSSRHSQEEWQKLCEMPFEPVCLTIYLSNHCNLRCSYCFAAPARLDRRMDKSSLRKKRVQNIGLPVIQEKIAEHAARIVASYCVQKNRPFTLVLHGGGEPTLHWKQLQRLVSLTQDVAKEHDIDWWGYIATNGVLSENKVKWLAGHFDMIGLSCDGPPMIQDVQRPTIRGAGTSKVLERTARLLKQSGTPYAVRATITPENAEYQLEIVNYIYGTLGANTIHFEPVFDPWDTATSKFLPADAENFVMGFLSAQRLAKQLGCELSLSGVRPDEIHGPYCNVLRDVLQLTPDGVVSACFLCTDGNKANDVTISLTKLKPDDTSFLPELDRIAGIRRRALAIPSQCFQCINIYHCVRECPEGCPVTNEDYYPRPEGFRCQVYKRLTAEWIFRTTVER
jgi:uncharacterized protein